MLLQFYQQIHLQVGAIKKLPEATSQICVGTNMGVSHHQQRHCACSSSFYWSLQPQCSRSYFQRVPLSQVSKGWPKPRPQDLRAREEYLLLLPGCSALGEKTITMLCTKHLGEIQVKEELNQMQKKIHLSVYLNELELQG